MEIPNMTIGIQLPSFIAFSRSIPSRFLKDSKLFLLLYYIAKRVKRSDNAPELEYLPIQLKLGEFIIGRKSTSRDTDLTESEYRTRFKVLKALNIIKNVRSTTKFTIGEWQSNHLVDLNIEYPIDQQIATTLTTNNKTNTDSSYISISNTYKDISIRILGAYQKYKEIQLQGDEIKYALNPIQSMLRSGRTEAQIVAFIKWISDNQDCGLFWMKSWDIKTVANRLPEFVAGRFNDLDDEDSEFPLYGSQNHLNK